MYLTSFMVSIHQRYLRQLKRALFGLPLSRGRARICCPVDEHSLSATEIDPEKAIAIDEGFIGSAYEKNGLKIEGKVRRVTWSANLPALPLQDMVIGCSR